LAQEVDCAIEVWVVDNASTDGTVDMVRKKYPKVKILTNTRNLGYSRAINQAAAGATGHWLLFLSSDADLGPASLGTMLEFARTHERVGALGPQTVDSNGEFVTSTHHPSLLLSVFAELTGMHRRLRRAGKIRAVLGALLPNSSGLTSDYMTDRQVKVIDGGCLLVNSEAFRSVGGLDPMIPQGPDDYDLCHRLRSAGFEIWFVAAAQATHRSSNKGDPTAMTPTYLRTFVPEVCYFYAKHGGAVKRIAARIIAVQLLRKYLFAVKRAEDSQSERVAAIEDALAACGSSDKYISLIERDWGPRPLMSWQPTSAISPQSSGSAGAANGPIGRER